MALVLTAAPAVEPVSLAEAKAHLRVDSDHEDALIAQLIVAARIFVERTLGLALIAQSWSYFLDALPRSLAVGRLGSRHLGPGGGPARHRNRPGTRACKDEQPRDAERGEDQEEQQAGVHARGACLARIG